MYIYIHNETKTSAYVYAYIHIYMHMYTYIYLYTYIYILYMCTILCCCSYCIFGGYLQFKKNYIIGHRMLYYNYTLSNK